MGPEQIHQDQIEQYLNNSNDNINGIDPNMIWGNAENMSNKHGTGTDQSSPNTNPASTEFQQVNFDQQKYLEFMQQQAYQQIDFGQIEQASHQYNFPVPFDENFNANKRKEIRLINQMP